MPYFFAIAGFAFFNLLFALATLGTWLHRPASALFPLVWRIWLWGSIGFLAANGLLLAALYPILTGVGISAAAPGTVDPFSVVLGFAVLFGPLVASAVGICGGGLLGVYMVRRKGGQSRAAA